MLDYQTVDGLEICDVIDTHGVLWEAFASNISTGDIFLVNYWGIKMFNLDFSWRPKMMFFNTWGQIDLEMCG